MSRALICIIFTAEYLLRVLKWCLFLKMNVSEVQSDSQIYIVFANSNYNFAFLQIQILSQCFEQSRAVQLIRDWDCATSQQGLVEWTETCCSSEAVFTLLPITLCLSPNKIDEILIICISLYFYFSYGLC